jgi:hypothetical protein
MSRLVSILIPAYNAEHWLADTIRSALSQTWPQTEIVVVDDGSTDRTLPIARQFESKNVLVVAQNNQGGAGARNTAFSLCQGDYIQWLDADDLLSPNKIALQMRASSKGGGERTLLSSRWGHFLHRPWTARFVATQLCEDLSPIEFLLRKWEHNLHMQTATWLVSRGLTEAAGSWNSNLLGDDDGEYFCRVVLAAEQILHVPDAHVFYRVAGSGSLSYIGRSHAKQDAQWLGMKLQLQHVLRHTSCARSRAAALTYLQTWAPYMLGRPDLLSEMARMAESLGGELGEPRVARKYAWLARLCGSETAFNVQQRYNLYKAGLLTLLDRQLYHLERLVRSNSASSGF